MITLIVFLFLVNCDIYIYTKNLVNLIKKKVDIGRYDQRWDLNQINNVHIITFIPLHHQPTTC